MAADLRTSLNGSGYASAAVTKAPHWHGSVAWDLLFNNMTSGLFLVAAVADLMRPEVFMAVVRVAYPLALLFLAADLACLVLDLGDPSRFHHMLRVFKPASPMSLGTWCLTAYALPLTAAAALSLWSGGSPALDWARKAAVILTLPPALGVAVYKGVLFSTTAQPGWRDGRWLGGYLANSALMLGCAELLVLAELLGQGRASAYLGPALILLLVLNMIVLALVAANLQPVLSCVYSPRQLGRLALFWVGVEALFPVALVLVGGHRFAVLLIVLLLLLASMEWRFMIVRLPHAAARTPAATPPSQAVSAAAR